MEHIKESLKELLRIAGFTNPVVELNMEGSRFSVILEEGEWLKEWIPHLVADLGFIARTIGRKVGVHGMVYVDVNNYRREREHLIAEIAKAAARKVLITKEDVQLPPMNAYERRLVHTELATRPDVKTESFGDKRDRRVIVKPLL
ncbi:MAG: hypothetical protein EXS60_01295 [Candidatus Pacebacteria bacterium]|nr:hypothetical protein [Candidatus Paceibacterota bacterium]